MKEKTVLIKRKKQLKAKTLLIGLVLCVLVVSSFSQALPVGHKTLQTISSTTNDAFFCWVDDFSTEQWIDPAQSVGYEIVEGAAQLKNTYAAWTDPSWTRLLPITITNNHPIQLSDYAVKLDITYDEDMKSDYSDIRFKQKNFPTTWLDYWIETSDTQQAIVWVNIPTLYIGSTTLYMFYGNLFALDQSNYYDVFSDWQESYPNDNRISYHSDSEGVWDPDVAYGDQRFLVAWEEGTGLPFIKQEIRASIFNQNGDLEKSDFRIYNDGGTTYRSENPSIAFGNGNYFVVWENYETPIEPATMNIKGRLVSPTGSLKSVFTVCNENNIQADPDVVYDSQNNHFCVVWEDARLGTSNYNIYGRLYYSNGNPHSAAKALITTANSQTEPCIAFDPIHEQYLVVWEEGEDPENGPFDIYVGLYDKTLQMIGPGSGANKAEKLIDGHASIDYNFPAVAFCPETKRYLVTWNDGDISDGDWYGNIWGTVLDDSGSTVVSPFKIRSGNFVCTDIALYLSSTFMVSYDDHHKIWGKLVASDGTVFSDEIQLSASTSAEGDWADIAAGDGRIFVSWEDTRIIYDPPYNDNPDIYANIWRLNIPSGEDLSFSYGTEKKLILAGYITSKEIAPDDLQYWHSFNVTYSGQATFEIRDSTGTATLIPHASPGEDLTGIDSIAYPALRLRAELSRANPSTSPRVDEWSLVYAGVDDDHPETSIHDIQGDLGGNNWYISNIKIFLSATDGIYGTGVNHTYYQIDDGSEQIYDDHYGINLPPEDPNQLAGEWDLYYWSVDKAGNLEPKQGPAPFTLDKAPPHCTITKPSDRESVQGDFWVEATASDQGSGIAYVLFDTGPPYEDPVIREEDDPPGSGIYRWLCARHFERSWRHIIAQVYDDAGHMYESNIWVYFDNADSGVYNPGYVYLFGNLTLGPIRFLENRNLAITIDSDGLFVRTAEQPEDAIAARFVASRVLLSRTFTADDLDLTDGCSVTFDLPLGFYHITVEYYNQYDQMIIEEDVIEKMFVILV